MGQNYHTVTRAQLRTLLDKWEMIVTYAERLTVRPFLGLMPEPIEVSMHTGNRALQTYHDKESKQVRSGIVMTTAEVWISRLVNFSCGLRVSWRPRVVHEGVDRETAR